MNIHDILSKASKLRIAVVGDFITDRYIQGTVDRISPEAPVQVLKVKSTRANPGGAGNVAENLRGLGVAVSLFYDEKNVPTKTRIMCGPHHLLRLDEESDPQWMDFENIDIGLDYGILHGKFDCVIISDYRKGMISENVAREVIGRCVNRGIPVVVDTKDHLEQFAEATVVKCNHKEWLAYSESVTGQSVGHLMLNWGISNIVVTRGQHGIDYWESEGQFGTIPGIPVDYCDACGAGDTVIGVIGMMIAMGYSVQEACELANIAAAYVCTKPGVYAIQKDDLIKRF